MSDEIVRLGLVEVANLIRRRKLSSVEVTRACIEQAQRVQGRINCFIGLEAEDALKAARRADRRLASGARVGPLHGVPLAHKDMYYRAGKVSTGGSKILRDYRPAVTSTAARRLDAAGAIWLGTLNMAEFAANPTGHNPHYGHCRNPWNTDHMTGGSSSGSGAAVAARACFGSLGSDTGGSIRLPAAACGVVGLKPTYGRVSRYGVVPRSWSQDTVGPLTRTVRDCARITRVLAGADPLDPTSSHEPVPDYEKTIAERIRGLRIGVPRNHFYRDATPDVERAMRASLDVLGALGAKLVDIEVPDPQELFHVSNLVSQCEAAAIHDRWLRTRPGDYYMVVRSRTETGYHYPATTYIEALNLRPYFLAEYMDKVFARVDILHTPVINMPVPTIAETDASAAGAVPAMVTRITRNTRPFNYLGLPALAVPAGFTDSGLPVSFQLAGRPFSEHLLFRVGHAYQSATDWHVRMPPAGEA